MEIMNDRILEGATHSPKREREEDSPQQVLSASQLKRLRKGKNLANSGQQVEKDRTRGRYACLGHRLKHKRCPLDCPERRPKPTTEPIKKESPPPKPKSLRGTAKKHVLKLEDSNISINVPLSLPKPQMPMLESHSHGAIAMVEGREANWDSVEWQGLAWDHEPFHENESWMDLKSSSHWEESKSKVSMDEGIASHDEQRYNEQDIINSWLNEESTGIASCGDDSANIDTNMQERRGSFDEDHTRFLLSKILLTRDMIERWLSEPYFNRLVKGCYVRVRVGEFMESPVYRIAYIEDVLETYFTPYVVLNQQTTTGLSLQIGNAKRVFPILAISNKPITESDFRMWMDEMDRCGAKLNPIDVQEKEDILRMMHSKYPQLERPNTFEW